MAVENGEVLQAVIDYITSDGVHIQQKLGYIAQFAAPQSEVAVLAAIASAVSAMMDAVAGCIHTSLEDPDVYVDVIEWVADHWEVVRNVGEVIAGTTPTNISQILPYQNAAVLVGRTARPRSRGRKFLPPFGEDCQDASVWTAAVLADLADALLIYLADIAVSVNNDLSPGVPSTVTGTFLPFTGGLVNDYVRTQRRRVPGVGF